MNEDNLYHSTVMFVCSITVGVCAVIMCWFMLNQEQFIKKETGRGQEVNQLYDFGSASGEPSPVFI